ncbi:Killer Cell Lectin-Like Receptor Subfamily G Member 1 [Manis pentadactyla]|nr:Killer Cell Lectin-Like Receptor Subfamily G Member 1 [Manis pentadactyla]
MSPRLQRGCAVASILKLDSGEEASSTCAPAPASLQRWARINKYFLKFGLLEKADFPDGLENNAMAN